MKQCSVLAMPFGHCSDIADHRINKTPSVTDYIFWRKYSSPSVTERCHSGGQGTLIILVRGKDESPTWNPIVGAWYLDSVKHLNMQKHRSVVLIHMAVNIGTSPCGANMHAL
ncbi:hypothetical protein IAQ61_001582 [Plenodomus lingam]|uniref:uncharacterized protein n=1 Tax=Leptosphaeria maculans TaxID=5022 RepID=UPI0033194998|nr:hypothetical protein IAQ61_001582 [Plenodomus lingam]